MITDSVLTLLRALSEPVVLVKPSGEIVAFSRRAEILLCAEPKRASSLAEFITAPSPEVKSYLQGCMRTGESIARSFTLRGERQLRCRFEGSRFDARPEYSEVLVWLRLFPQEPADSRFLLLNERIAQLSKEVHARRRAELALRERTAQFEILLNQAPLGVYLIDADFRIQQINPTAQQFFGLPEAIGRSVDEVMHILWSKRHAAEIIGGFRQTLVTGATHLVPEFNEMRQDRGRRECYEWQVNRMSLSEGRYGLVCYFRDISVRKQSEEALRKTEKLAATGRLASSIAHEINNPLEGVTNLLYLARQDSELRPETRHYLDTAEQELARVATIAKQTLGFYRESSSPTWFSVPETIRSVMSMYEHRMASRGVKVVTDLRDTPMTCARVGEFKQVLSNLFLNALDAMPKEEPCLRVKVSLSREWNRTDERGVRITIADNGCGIPPENFARLFEAFFTTKPATGTGLGLWLSKEIVHKHGGRMHVRSCTGPSRGTTFSILWPLKPSAESINSESIG